MRHVLPALISAALLAGCGGGGSAVNTAGPMPAQAANGTSSNRTPIATATLTLKFSPNFHTAKTAINRKTGSGAARKPAYVNSNSNYLDIWVISGGTPVHVVNTFSSPPNVTGSADGSQTLSIPLFSAAASQIVAFEADQPDGTPGNLLAVGEADIAAIAPGSAPQIALTMSMNARNLGVMSDPDDANGDATVSSTYNTFNGTCVSPISSPRYFFAADAENGFIDLAGAGGTSLPTVTTWTSQASNPIDTLTQGPGVNGAYSANINNVNDLSLGIVINLSAVNPAYALANDALFGLGVYPGIDFMVSSFNDDQFSLNMRSIFFAGSALSNQITVLPRDLC
jgi:hypothetical protein